MTEIEQESEQLGGKRGGNGFVDEYGEIKESKKFRAGGEGHIQMRLLLVGRVCGAIIGKGGESITRLRKEHNVEVNMPATRTPDRVLTLDGEISSCIEVVKEILPACSQVPYPVSQKCNYEINLLVHTEGVGIVIGKGGAKIKEIREESSGKIKVYQECLPNSNERVIAIGGDDEAQIIHALKLVLNLLKDQPRRAVSHYDPANKPSEIGSGLLGSGNMHGGGGWGNDNHSDGGFSYSNRSMAQNGTVPQISMSGGPTPLMASIDNSSNNTQASFLRLETNTTVKVPNEMCGIIIGKGGRRINEIRNTSGAKVNFSHSEKESKEDRIITLTGTQHQVQVAEQLMTECVRNHGHGN